MLNRQRQRGFTLIETLIGSALLLVVGVALASGIATGYRGLALSQELVNTDNLAEAQVEYIKSQGYIPVSDYNPADPDYSYEIITVPVAQADLGFTVELDPPELHTEAGRGNFELQTITVRVKRHGNLEIAITFFRVGPTI
jgi:prepilin-type N-terminal cleavage/methylation domain-containing protein